MLVRAAMRAKHRRRQKCRRSISAAPGQLVACVGSIARAPPKRKREIADTLDMGLTRALAATVVLLSSFGGAAGAATIEGTASPDAVVWASPLAPTRSTAATPQTFEIRNINRTFDPDLLVVPVGSSVRFSNDDPFFHSIFSASEADPFDLGFYSIGPGKTASFPLPGVIRVRCHIHGIMHAVVVVVDGPVTRADPRSGAFKLAVAPGNYVFHAWDPVAATEQRASVTIPPNAENLTLPQPLRP
jgi:plastocyanin